MGKHANVHLWQRLHEKVVPGHVAVNFLIFNMKHMRVKLFQFSHVMLGNIGMETLDHVYLCGSKHM